MAENLRVRLGAIAGLLGLSLLTLNSGPAQAQAVDPLADLNSSDMSSDPFSSNGSGQMGGMFDILHRIQTSNGGSSENQLQQNREEITNGAAEFRRRQLELLNQSPNSSPAPEADPNTPAGTALP